MLIEMITEEIQIGLSMCEISYSLSCTRQTDRWWW